MTEVDGTRMTSYIGLRWPGFTNLPTGSMVHIQARCPASLGRCFSGLLWCLATRLWTLLPGLSAATRRCHQGLGARTAPKPPSAPEATTRGLQLCAWVKASAKPDRCNPP